MPHPSDKELIPINIEKRAIELILNGVDPVDALKQSLIDECNLIGSLITSANQLTERGKIASEYLLSRYKTTKKINTPRRPLN